MSIRSDLSITSSQGTNCNLLSLTYILLVIRWLLISSVIDAGQTILQLSLKLHVHLLCSTDLQVFLQMSLKLHMNSDQYFLITHLIQINKPTQETQMYSLKSCILSLQLKTGRVSLFSLLENIDFYPLDGSTDICVTLLELQVRLWAVQLIMVSTPSLLVALHVAYREHRECKQKQRLYQDKGSIDGGLLFTYIISLILKTTFEVATLLAFYFLYSGFNVPRLLQREESPCPNTVDCYISKATEKKIFLYIMGCTSILCSALNVVEMVYIITKQCWKCFSRKYVPVNEGVICHDQPPSMATLGSAAAQLISTSEGAGLHSAPAAQESPALNTA